MAMILPWLFLGSGRASMDEHALRAQRITHIINATSNKPNCFSSPHSTSNLSPAPSHGGGSGGIEYLRLSLRDSEDENLFPVLEECFNVIVKAREAGGACLIHCSAGVSRSASLVLAYLLACEGMSLIRALALTREQRPQVSPNPGFMAQLVAIERKVSKQVSLDIYKYTDDRFSSTAELQLMEEMHAGDLISEASHRQSLKC